MNNINFKKRIYFEIETKKRELLSRCYFALLAANKGYSVIIGKKNKLYQNLKNLQNGYFIFKSAGRSVKKLAPKLRELNYLPFSIDEEGGVIISPHDTTRRVDEDSLDKIEKYLSWGNDEKNAILSSKINYKDKIINVGNPRIDLLKFKNRKIYDRKVNELIKKFGKFNLYATSFHKFNSVGNSKNPNWIEEDVKNNLILKEHKEHITIINETQKKNLEGTLNFFK